MLVRFAHLQLAVTRFMAGLAARLNLGSFASDAAFVVDKGAPAAEADRYLNTTLQRIRVFGSG